MFSVLLAVLGFATAWFIRRPKGKLIMALILNDSQKVNFKLQPLTAKGKPAKVDGIPVWSVSDPAVLEVVPATDGMSATVNALADGDAQVSAEADADMGSGIREITATADISVVSEATTLSLTAGIPETR